MSILDCTLTAGIPYTTTFVTTGARRSDKATAEQTQKQQFLPRLRNMHPGERWGRSGENAPCA